MFAPAGAPARINAATSRGMRRPSPYLTGNFTPLRKPCTEPTPCEVVEMCQKGAWKAVAAKDLPEELRGAYVRTGPNPTSWDPYDERYHWFDGDGLVHVVKLGADKVTFNCDYVKTAKYTVENKDPQKPMACFPRLLGDLRGPSEAVMVGLGKRAKAMIAAGVYSFKDGFGTANTAFAFFDDMLWVVNEADAPYWVVLEEDGRLSTVGRFNPFKWMLDKDAHAADVEPEEVMTMDLRNKVMHAVLVALLANIRDLLENDTIREWVEKFMQLNMPFQKGNTFPITAHPKQLGGKGPLYVYGFDSTGLVADHLDYAELPGGGPPMNKTSPILNADGARASPVFLHEFATTKDYLIFIDNPIDFGIRQHEDLFPFKHNKERKFRLGVLHKRNPGKGIVWYGPDPDEVSARAASYIVFHLGNAWQDKEDSRVIKLYGMAFQEFEFDGMGKHVPQLVEFTLRVGGDFPQYTTKILMDQGKAFIGEFPRVPAHLTGLPTRYIYAVKGEVGVDGFCGILKADVEKGQHQRLDIPNGGGGEITFVPARGFGKEAQELEEDDGWLLMILTEVPQQPPEVEDDTSRASWLMIYSAKDLQPAYRIQLPVRVPYGLHGIHLTEAQLQKARERLGTYSLQQVCRTAAPLNELVTSLQASMQSLPTQSTTTQSSAQTDAVAKQIKGIAETAAELKAQVQALQQMTDPK